MKGFDVTVTGGNVVTAWGEVQTTIGIISGKVAALLDPATPVKARVAVDANGKTVLPGLVDAHVHFREPGLAHKEGFETGTKAAAAGGVTTVMVQPTDDPVTALPHDFIEKRRLAEGRAYVDYALQVCVGEELSHIKTLADIGAVSFELFLAYPAPPHRITSNDLLLACLERIADVGAVAGIDPSDQSIVGWPDRPHPGERRSRSFRLPALPAPCGRSVRHRSGLRGSPGNESAGPFASTELPHVGGPAGQNAGPVQWAFGRGMSALPGSLRGGFPPPRLPRQDGASAAQSR